MKKLPIRLLVAAAVFIVLLGWILAKERGRAPEKGEIFKLKTEQANALTVKTLDKTTTLRKQGDQWTLEEPIRGWADKDAAERMINAIARLNVKGKQGVNLDEDKWGLKKPSLTATLTYDGNRTVTVYLGAQAPINSEYFGKIEGKNQLYFMPSSVYSDLTQPVDTLRDKALVHLKKDDVKSVTLQYPDRVLTVEQRGTKEEPKWFLTQPYEAKADEWGAKQIAEKLADMKADGFAPEQPAAGKSYGLDKPTIKATLVTVDGKKTVVNFGGKGREVTETTPPPTSGPAPTPPTGTPKDIVYAQVEGRPEVLLIADSNMSDLQKTDMDLRDKHILDVKKDQVRQIQVERKQGVSFSAERSGPDTWRLVTPTPAKANKSKIDDLLWDVTELEAKEFLGDQKDLKQYGLAISETVYTLTVTGQSEPIKIYLGYEKSQGLYYARTSLSNQVYVVGDMLINDLPKKADDLKEGASAPTMPPPSMPGGMPTPSPSPGGGPPPPSGR